MISAINNHIECVYCCSLRGKIVKDVAKEFSVTKVATGVTTNDTVEYALMCLLKGRFDTFCLPVYNTADTTVKMISPIFNITGLECGIYANLNNVNTLSEDCTYCNEHLRDDISKSLNLLEDRNPGILNAFYNGYLKIVSSNNNHHSSDIELASSMSA